MLNVNRVMNDKQLRNIIHEDRKRSRYKEKTQTEASTPF